MPLAPLSPGLRRLALVALAVGLLFRLVPLLVDPQAPLKSCDGSAYWHLAVNLASGRGLTFTDPHVAGELCPLPLGPSHHYSPLLPFIEAGFVLVFGPNAFSLATPLLLISFATVAATYLATRDLFGRDAALLVAAAVSLEWTGIFFGTRSGYSENLVVLTLVLTLWAILKSLEQPRAIVWAGLFAGLGYLSKASVGWFFLLAGFGGLAWRLAYRGWRVLRDPTYLGAIGVFSAFFAAWSYRNLSLFWDGTPGSLWYDWQTSVTTAAAVHSAIAQPARLAIGLGAKLPLLVLAVLVPLAPILPRVRRALADWRREDVSGLWLAAALVFALGWLFAASFWVFEGSRLLWGDPIRYVAPAQVPLLWLAVRGDGPHRLPAWTYVFGAGALAAWFLPLFLRPGQILGPL